MKRTPDSQSGNVLWFILLAVALLGFLTLVVSRIGSSVEQSGNVEMTRIKASALMRYMASIETSVSKMLAQGISENDLDFAAINAGHNNPNCTQTQCEVFHVEGGGMSFRKPSEILGDTSITDNWVVSSGNRIYNIGCNDNTEECTDLLLLMPHVPKSVCLQINAIAHITNPSGDAPRQNEIYQGTGFDGTYTPLSGSYIGGTNAVNESPQVAGKPAGCVYEFGGGQNTYYAYKVLLAR